MVVDPEVINRFLNYIPTEQPTFKHADPAYLHKIIYSHTGVHFKPGRTEPRSYQLEGIASALYHQRSFLFFAMRTGKTMMALNWANHLRRAGLSRRKGLVVTHAPIALQVWHSETQKHSELSMYAVQSGHKPNDFVDVLELDCDLIVISWGMLQELLSIRKKNRKGEWKLYPNTNVIPLVAEYFDHVIIDEIHFTQDLHSLRFNIAVDLFAQCNWRLGLTGTPFGRNPFAIWSQAYLIDNGDMFGRSYYFFEQAFGKRQYNHFTRQKQQWVFDKKLERQFRAKLQAMSLTYAMEEIQEVNIISNVVELTMTDEQKKVYNDLVAHFAQVDPQRLQDVDAIFIRMRQVASGFLPYVGADDEAHVKWFKESPKLEWLKTLFVECPKHVQAVIFVEYQASGRLLAEAATQAKVTNVRLHGQMTDGERTQSLAAFQSGRAQFLIANYRVGGVSIDLPMADYLVFYESPTSPIARAQAAARPMARGKRPLLIDDLVCAPVEQRILGFIKEGKDLARSLLGDRASLLRGLRA